MQMKGVIMQNKGTITLFVYTICTLCRACVAQYGWKCWDGNFANFFLRILWAVEYTKGSESWNTLCEFNFTKTWIIDGYHKKGRIHTWKIKYLHPLMPGTFKYWAVQFGVFTFLKWSSLQCPIDTCTRKAIVWTHKRWHPSHPFLNLKLYTAEK